MNKNSEIDKLSDKEEILEVLSVVINRLDDIEEKIDQLNDPYNLDDYFKLKNTMPDGYTLVDTSGESDTSRTFGAIIDG